MTRSGGPLVVSVRDSRERIAFEEIYETHYRAVYRFALTTSGSSADAEEITAEAFERAWRSWGGSPELVLPWLLTTARRISTDRWRRARRWAQLVLRLRSRSYADAGEEQTEFWLWFHAVSKILTTRQRAVLALRYQHDLTDADIGEIMNLSASGVRSLAGRALAALRNHPELL